MDPLSIVVDEVALEGLDGTTIPSLWIRLEDRKPKFPLKLDGCTKELIWKSLISNADLKFYQLPQERGDIVLFDRYEDVDLEAGILNTQSSPDSWKDVYPVHIIENHDGIQGSCATFKQRRDVTKDVRSKSLAPIVNLQEALQRYGRRLVVVASQKLRFRTLIGCESDPDLILNDDSYCVLERVGRGRWQGELQKDLHGGAFKIDARKLFYMRKSLIRHGLITMQSYCTRLKTGQQQSSILLLLKRFHINRRSKYEILMECVSNLLQQAPGQFVTLAALRQHINVSEKTLRRTLVYMRSAKLVEYLQYPLADLDPSAGPCLNRKGNKVLVRCLKLLKPYSKKSLTDDDDDDDEEEDDDPEAKMRAPPSEGRLMERDVLSQAYNHIFSCGTKGISQSAIGMRMNVGKLESRMICRQLERFGAVKGFMEDEGRQRTTKYISHKFVGVSDRLRRFAKEQERNKFLASTASNPSDALAPSAAESAERDAATSAGEKKTPNADGEEKEGEAQQASSDVEADAAKKSGAKRKTAARKRPAKRKRMKIPAAQTSPVEPETSPCSESTATPVSASPPGAEQAVLEEEEKKDSSSSATPSLQNEAPTLSRIVEVKDVQEAACKNGRERTSETYRLLRRKNLIVDAVNSTKVIEGLFPLQKMINDEEKQGGFVSKCCKKTILRLVQKLSREGLLRLYSTTVIQDGIHKKVELIVHPSVQPKDDIVQRAIEQIRSKIANSYTAACQQQAEEKAREEGLKSLAGVERRALKEDFKPEPVRGLGKTLGFQPKMPRLRVTHTYLWYLIYGHSHQHNSADSASTSQTPDGPPGRHPANRQSADSTPCNLDMASSGDEEGNQKEGSEPGLRGANMKVYVDEVSWKRFIPPVRTHEEFGSGWAMVGDLLLCLPLSVFIQITQINYKVERLEEYLNDPVKQHLPIRGLPAAMRRQLLYKRKYIFSFHENLQKLVYMGLLRYGPAERFKEKDQLLVYLKRSATIVDTTSAEAHYWLVTESPDKPFDRRRYTFSSAEDVENYWFDLMCVCLNTPLGIIRNKRNATEDDANPSFVRERNVFIGLAFMLKGSREVCDDGAIPGDGKGAAGLDSEFFAHLKRNWFWTSHLLSCKTPQSDLTAKENRVRLKSLLSRSALRIALKAGGTAAPRYVTTKQMLALEKIETSIEPASRNQQVVGGKGQRRKRSKKEVVKPCRRKKKEPKKRTPAHDEADHKALKMMTRQRVYWSMQEDALMMLCSAASHLLNSKVKRPFVPYCLVRDLLHSESEKSMDKTSVAVGRRTRYILKNPQTLLNCRICLAEVYQDEALMAALEEEKPARPDDPKDCGRGFSTYVRLLRQKFGSALTPCDATLPGTKRQLFARFKVSAIQCGRRLSCRDALSSTDDIHSIVLHNLIQSTLALNNSQLKSSTSFQTFQLYSKYDQELLCKVFLQCRKRGLVNRRRVNQPSGPKKNRALPILPMSYQLSQTYYRCFSSRFPHSLCTDAFRFMRNLMNTGTGGDRPVTEFCLETEVRSETGEGAAERGAGSGRTRRGSGAGDDDGGRGNEPDVTQTKANDGAGEEEDGPAGSEQTDMLPFTLDAPGGACAVSLSLMSLGLLSVHISIPKQIVVVDSSLVDNDAVKRMAVLEDEDKDEDDGEEGEGEARKKLEVKAHQASHTNYLMMRGYCSPGIVKRRDLNTGDSIVVESCLMRLKLRSTPAERGRLSGEDFPTLDLTKCGPSLLPSSLTASTRSSSSSSSSSPPSGFTPQDTEACAEIVRSVDAAGERGLDMRDLYETHRDLQEPRAGRSRSLQQYMQDLEEDGRVLRVGGLGLRWVLMRHADPWLLTVRSKPLSQSRLKPDGFQNWHGAPATRKRVAEEEEEEEEEEEPPAKKSAGQGGSPGDTPEETQKEEGGGDRLVNVEGEEKGRSPPSPSADDDGESVSFISRPWRMVDGGLNRPVAKGMLEAVLYHVMSRPGLTLQSLTEHYEGVLQPTALLELVQALEDIGCLMKRSLVRAPKPSLFSRRRPHGETDVELQEPDSVFFEPTLSCVLRLSRVLPNERHWNNCLP
ncbi:general transcription factor 3C polypeptide 1 [Brachionichthys hirsutus]|uniref:general transcription factor 3C polypeptide 1 n=1 Tax=Brachionichthys hirsutus TaxID=412623 RepID=UPI003604C526